jgi:hypothetical protein
MHQPEDPEAMRHLRGLKDEESETEAHGRHALRPDQQDDPEMRGRRLLQDDDEGPETEAHIRRT